MIGDELTLGDYAAVLRRRLAVVVLLFLASVLLAAVWSLSSTPMYRSTARVLLDQADASDAFDSVFFNSEFAERLAANEVALIESQLVDDLAESRLGFEAEVSASGSKEFDVVSVSAKDADPGRAQRIAQVYVQAYLDVRLQLYMNERVDVAEQLVERIASIEDQIELASKRTPTVCRSCETVWPPNSTS